MARTSERIRLCDVHHAVRMFGRRVHSEQFHIFGASINEVVFDSGGHYKHIADLVRECRLLNILELHKSPTLLIQIILAKS